MLAGLDAERDSIAKPDFSASETVPLRLRRKDKCMAVSNARPVVSTAAVPLNGKRKSLDMMQNQPAGVGFVNFGDELIDEDTLLTEEDLKRPANIRYVSISE